MSSPSRTAGAVLDEEFLARRMMGSPNLGGAGGAATDDPRRARLDEAIRLLLAQGSERAAQVQLLFSRSYDPNWRQSMGV
ncbi:MAG TPA: hypothetical protein PKC18_01295 [Lacipirellulaceae bacterium]|nr:hypothetical protein [Lacipirellulaceae bacterium]